MKHSSLLRSLAFVIAFVFVFVSPVCAQQVTISPVPQNVKWGAKAFDHGTALTLVGADDADADAVAALRSGTTTAADGVQVVLGESGDANVADYESLIPVREQGYYLSVTPDRIVVAGRDSVGTYYGVQSLLQVLAADEVMQVEVKDWPSTPLRGVIEGFYGNPWSTHDRERQFDFYGANKMNIYVYGPKDDPYHRAQWRENYPTAEGKVISHLAEYAARHKVDFVWAVHPGGDIKWNLADSMNVVKKMESVYALGVRTFAVFFDDIGGEGAKAEKQAGLLNYVTDNFVHKHADVKPLIMCPTEYNRAWSGSTYLPTLGSEMYEEVRIMWTGNSVVDMIDKSDMTWINDKIQRKAFIWLNYPVNDYCIGHMLMGKTYGNDSSIGTLVSAFCSNPMEYAEASKVSLYSIADYAWNMKDYDALDSWYRSMAYIMPTATEAFRIFCENNVDLGSTYHGLRRENESQRFAALIQQVTDGVRSAEVRMQFDTLVWAADALRDDSLNHPEMIAEITPWLCVMRSIGKRGQLVCQLAADLDAQDPEAFIAHYKEISALQQTEDAVMSRDFSGTIKKAHPVVAGEVVVPYIKQQLSALVQDYKSSYSEGWENFPMVVLENGNYYIRSGGKYLTDANASATRTGDYPVWQADRDTINPQRQQWTITLDATTDRYKITNTQDGRYINEKGAFWASRTNNPYEAAWHTYTLQRMNGLYAIRNAGSAGTAFWTATDTRIQPGSNTGTVTTGDFIFEIIPVEGTVAHPVIKPSCTYYILNSEGLALTDLTGKGTGTPTFKPQTAARKRYQQFVFTPVEATGRWKITANKSGAYVNEIGNFGTNAYSDNWNTYVITEMGGKFAIQNADKAGTDYWTIQDDRVQKGSAAARDSYIFSIVLAYDPDGVEDISASADLDPADATPSLYDLSGRAVPAKNLSALPRGVYVQNGQKILRE